MPLLSGSSVFVLTTKIFISTWCLQLQYFVLIDLKLGKLKHQDVGQMDTYVRLYNEKYKAADDNPTVGLVLCSEKSEAVARYSVLADQKQFFAVKYLPYLPSEEELQAALAAQREAAIRRLAKVES